MLEGIRRSLTDLRTKISYRQPAIGALHCGTTALSYI